MIRIDADKEWWLIPHQTHAALAGEFARHWKNAAFAPPDPFCHVLEAVARHDDSWAERDSAPLLTPEGQPSAFSSELVGSYDAFEEIDLESYLAVRGAATEAAAERDPFAAILISMHTVNLLTEQADLTQLNNADRSIHAAFIQNQQKRQRALKNQLASFPNIAPFLTDAHLNQCFRFLQACDSFSLYACVNYSKKGQLRHPQNQRNGNPVTIEIEPLGNHSYRLNPWPLDEPAVTFELPFRRLDKTTTANLTVFQSAYSNASLETLTITARRD